MTIVFQCMFQSFEATMNLMKKNKALQDIELVYSIIRNELYFIPEGGFKKVSSDGIIWTVGKGSETYDSGLIYDISTNSLFKVEGEYDIEKKGWVSKRRFLIAKNIIFQFAVTDTDCKEIVCTASFDNATFSRVIMPYSRIYTMTEKTE